MKSYNPRLWESCVFKEVDGILIKNGELFLELQRHGTWRLVAAEKNPEVQVWLHESDLQAVGKYQVFHGCHAIDQHWHRRARGDPWNNVMGQDSATFRYLRHFPELVDVAVQMLGAFKKRVREDPRLQSLKSFKKETYDGYDVIRNQLIDYGNREYSTLYWAMMSYSKAFADGITALASDLTDGAALLDNTHTSENSVNKQGDVIELLLATLRGSAFYSELSSSLTDLPELFLKVTGLLKIIHLLDARIHTGRLKWQNSLIGTWRKHYRADSFTSLQNIWAVKDESFCCYTKGLFFITLLETDVFGVLSG